MQPKANAFCIHTEKLLEHTDVFVVQGILVVTESTDTVDERLFRMDMLLRLMVPDLFV